MPTIDLNCDMGEGFGPWPMGNDAELMKYISSANVACGFHAGDPSTMRNTVELAIENNVAVGAHPGYPDLQGFGRRNMSLSADEVYDIVLYQVAALMGICEASGASLRHVKPHGALYNQAARSEQLSCAIASAVKSLDGDLVLFGLSGSLMIDEAQKLGLRTASEVFADRTYLGDGSLTPRSQPDALITSVERSVDQALKLALEQGVTTITGERVAMKAETICIHGDGDHAVEFASAICNVFRDHNIEVKAV